MVVGFNHNFKYMGEVFHVQTEDGGLNTTNIITLLYRGGTILARQKTSYADIAKADNLEQVVEELMKEQHKEMLRRLKAGDFDDVIERILKGGKTVPEEKVAEVQAPADADAQPEITLVETVVEELEEEPIEEAIPIVEEDLEEAEPEFDLDDVILSYLMGDDD
ncbi:MAG: hypothetical protein C0623_05580 [Desulfuromonas sp.]|nr:MAG: hypothetical protein C0623_05580 [Desulfuromonas sp.]